jgi:hypothetical protein
MLSFQRNLKNVLQLYLFNILYLHQFLVGPSHKFNLHINVKSTNSCFVKVQKIVKFAHIRRHSLTRICHEIFTWKIKANVYYVKLLT